MHMWQHRAIFFICFLLKYVGTGRKIDFEKGRTRTRFSVSTKFIFSCWMNVVWKQIYKPERLLFEVVWKDRSAPFIWLHMLFDVTWYFDIFPKILDLCYVNVKYLYLQGSITLYHITELLLTLLAAAFAKNSTSIKDSFLNCKR